MHNYTEKLFLFRFFCVWHGSKGCQLPFLIPPTPLLLTLHSCFKTHPLDYCNYSGKGERGFAGKTCCSNRKLGKKTCCSYMVIPKKPSPECPAFTPQHSELSNILDQRSALLISIISNTLSPLETWYIFILDASFIN